ncbi:MAG: anti-sigma factor [Gammaproteobacteria bacterium]|nr:anti-sigma factor [Gammaproteobacteria bacterium]
MNYRDPTLRERLAAEFVLGTLHGAARQRFLRLLRTDAALRADVTAWERRLSELLLQAAAPPVAPPARVWRAIERRLDNQPHLPGWRQRLSFWRTFAIGAVAAALLLYIGVTPLTSPPAAPSFMAMLQDRQAQSTWLINTTRTTGEIVIKPLQPQTLAQQRALELWLIPADGTPRSLGLIAPTDATTLVVAQALQPMLIPGALLAISLEPAGGSPTGSPTGPVLFKGAWHSLS